MNRGIDFFPNLVGCTPISPSLRLLASLVFPPFPLPPSPFLPPFPTPYSFIPNPLPSPPNPARGSGPEAL